MANRIVLYFCSGEKCGQSLYACVKRKRNRPGRKCTKNGCHRFADCGIRRAFPDKKYYDAYVAGRLVEKQRSAYKTENVLCDVCR